MILNLRHAERALPCLAMLPKVSAKVCVRACVCKVVGLCASGNRVRKTIRGRMRGEGGKKKIRN